jgi:hypothetical protein
MTRKTLWPVSQGQSRMNETNDCTVRALANAAGWDYSEAHALLSKHGRRFRKGAVFSVYHKAYAEAGLHLVGIHGSTRRARFAGNYTGTTPGRGMTVETALRGLQDGRYVVLITGHAFAVVEGRIIDKGGTRAGSHVFAVYKVPTKNQ